MRNTGNLKRGNGLGGSSNSLGGGGRLASRIGIKRRSDKMQEFYEEKRIPFVEDFLRRHQYCMFQLWLIGDDIYESPPLSHAATRSVTSCGRRADDIHEIVPRGRGGNAAPEGDGSEKNFLSLCRTHHSFITQNPKWSKDRGYTK